MNRLVSFFEGNRKMMFFILVLTYLITIIPGLATTRGILCDESWYSNTGYNFSIGNGFFNTNVGVGGNSNFLLPFLIGISFKLFGVSILTARIVAVCCGVIFIFALRKIYNLLEIKDQFQYLSFLVLLTVPFFNSVFRYARPECVSVTLLVISIYFYLQFLINSNYTAIIWCGLFLSLGFLAHPFISVFILIIGIHFVYLSIRESNKNITTFYPIFVFFSFVLLSVVAFLLVDSYYNHDRSLSIFSSTNSLLHRTAIKDGVMDHPFQHKLSVILNEWFLSKRVVFSVPLLFVMVIALFSMNRIVRNIAFLGFTFLIIAFFLFQDELQMSAYIYMYFLAISIIVFPFIFEYKFFNIRYIGYASFLVFVMLNLFATVYNNFNKMENTNLKLESELPTIIPNDSKVFAPIEFWFALHHTTFFSNIAKDNDRTSVYCPNYDYHTFDYLVLNNGIEINDLDEFRLVKSYNTLQYGLIRVYHKLKK